METKNFYFTTFKDVKLPNMLYCSLQISLVANVLTYFGKEEGKVYFISSTAMPQESEILQWWDSWLHFIKKLEEKKEVHTS